MSNTDAECVTKPTPGPWRQSPGGYIHGSDCIIAKVGSFEDAELTPHSGARWIADAHLIAAAPIMLAALKSCDCPGGGWNGQPKDTIPTVEDCVAYGHCGCTLGAAVKKAEGRDV